MYTVMLVILRVFDDKTCAHDELIHVVHVWYATCI